LRYRLFDRLPGVIAPSQVASGPSADTILVFRDTATEGDYINIEGWVTPAMVDGSAEFGMAQLMKKQWLAAGLEWTSQQETLASSSSILQRLIVQVRRAPIATRARRRAPIATGARHRAPIATGARPGERRPALERKLFFVFVSVSWACTSAYSTKSTLSRGSSKRSMGSGSEGLGE
jgi:hypothetical protein